MKEIRCRLGLLKQVGLHYLPLDRASGMLSGGEAQRIRLASQIGSRLVGVLYVLDEPSTSLLFHDIKALLAVLQRLVDAGHTVLVVEHNLDVVKVADHVIDLGPEGGAAGGRILATGTPKEVARCVESHTGAFLREM